MKEISLDSIKLFEKIIQQGNISTTTAITSTYTQHTQNNMKQQQQQQQQKTL